MENKKLALLTGASAGVGREMAFLLSEAGWDLIITARSLEKLEALKNELETKYSNSVSVFSVDLSTSGAAQKVLDFCIQNNYQIDLLINNAGAGLFGESVELGTKVTPMISLNVIALTELCSLFGKVMKEKGCGSILNIGSIAGNQPTAQFASYAASKSYVLNYSLALRHELKKYGINVTCAQPGYIRTAFDDNCNIVSEKYKKFSYNNGMTAKAVATKALKAVFSKRSYVRLGFANKCAAFFSGLIPRNFLAWVLSKSIASLTK